jgi:Flp pilus assembly protein CpaB
MQPVTVAARDIASGSTLTAADLTTATATLPLATPPIDQLVGEVVRGPLTPGEPVTITRITPGRQVDPEPGTVVFPLTLADERIAALLQSGDRVDVLVTPDALHEGEPRQVAADVEILTVAADDPGGFQAASPQSGSVVLLALPEEEAPELAAIRRSDHVSVAIR